MTFSNFSLIAGFMLIFAFFFLFQVYDNEAKMIFTLVSDSEKSYLKNKKEILKILFEVKNYKRCFYI